MGKIYNVQLNSANASTVTTAYSNVTYNIDWADLLPPHRRFKVTFAFMSNIIYGNANAFPIILTNLLGNTYRPATNGYQNSYYLGYLQPIPVIFPNSTTFSTYNNYKASINDNAPIYLENRPLNNNLQVKILNGTTTSDFQGNLVYGTGGGTLTQSDNIITVVTATDGIITIGTVFTVGTTATRTVIAFISGTGGVGTYLSDVSINTTTETAYSFPFSGVANRAYMPPYILNLSFEEVE